MLFAAYRADQYADPDGFLISLGMVLESYSDGVILYVADPRTGIQRRSTWPPSIAEVVAACDDRHAQLLSIERYKNWGSNNNQKLEGPKVTNPSYDELIAKYGPNFGLKPGGV